MIRPIKIILLFEIGIILAILLFKSPSDSSVLSIASHLPDSVFENTDNLISIIFTGDVMLGRTVNTQIQKYQDSTWPFKNIASTLAEADITIINLESPFISNCKPTDTGMIFCADPLSVAGLELSGVDYATLANNHINNYGQEGIDETILILKENFITPIIHSKTVFNTVKNTKIAILAFSDLPQLDEDILVSQISESKNSANLVITTFHWGAEYQKYPTVRQVYLAHLAIDSGADIVVGHHPHQTQTEEIYQGKPVIYSLGNLVFDQMWSEETRLGQILKVTYDNSNLIKKELIPIKIFDFGQPSINYGFSSKSN